jgi:metal-responsive CopG/Arc/MetJ family transcriptional regulator
MAQTKFAAEDLISSPMVNISLLVPRVLLDQIDTAAAKDDPSVMNRSSWCRRALIDRLKREATR